MNEYIYVFDSKLYAYNEVQRGSPISNIFNTVARDLMKLKKKGKIYVTFDIGKSSYRLAEQSYYKGDRRKAMAKKTEAEILEHAQFNEDYEKLVELFKLLNTTVIAVDGVEADDLVSLVALKHPTAKVTIMTADRDHLHSVVGQTNVRMYSGREQKYLTHNYVVKEYGCHTRRQFSVLKAIAGDDGDTLKAFRNMGPVKSKKVFTDIYEKYEDPTDGQIIEAIEEYLENNKRIKIHEYHIEEGRDTVEKVFKSNMRVGATFEDLSKMTEKQVEEYENCFHTEPNESHQAFLDKCIELFGYPIVLNETAKRVYNVK